MAAVQAGQQTPSDQAQALRVQGDSNPDSYNQRSGSSGASYLSAIERQATVKMCMYMLGCIVQYLPGIPYALSYLGPSQPFPLYCIAILSINCGGLVNATALILNEGLGRKIPSTQGTFSTWAPTANSAGTSTLVPSTKSDPKFGGNSSWVGMPSFQGMEILNGAQQQEGFGAKDFHENGSEKMHTRFPPPQVQLHQQSDRRFQQQQWQPTAMQAYPPPVGAQARPSILRSNSGEYGPSRVPTFTNNRVNYATPAPTSAYESDWGRSIGSNVQYPPQRVTNGASLHYPTEGHGSRSPEHAHAALAHRTNDPSHPTDLDSVGISQLYATIADHQQRKANPVPGSNFQQRQI